MSLRRWDGECSKLGAVSAFMEAPGPWASPKAHLGGMTTMSSGSGSIVAGNYPTEDAPYGAPRQLCSSECCRSFLLVSAGEGAACWGARCRFSISRVFWIKNFVVMKNKMCQINKLINKEKNPTFFFKKILIRNFYLKAVDYLWEIQK